MPNAAWVPTESQRLESGRRCMNGKNLLSVGLIYKLYPGKSGIQCLSRRTSRFISSMTASPLNDCGIFQTEYMKNNSMGAHR